MKLSTFRRSALVAIVLFLGACATGQNTNVTQTQSNAQFMAASATERADYLATIKNEDIAITQKNDVEYAAGRPVAYGDSKTGYTIQWARRAGVINFYPGHTTGSFGQETSAIMTLAADSNGHPVLKDGRPVVLMANTSVQEGLGRFFVRGGFQVLGATMNGALAANIMANVTCSENCGSPIYVSAVSGSESNATGTGTATITDGCATCAILD